MTDTAPVLDVETNSSTVETEYDALPEGVRAILIGGVMQVLEAPSPAHSNARTNLCIALNGRPGDWIILAGPELQLGRGPDRLAPDVAGWRRERLSKLPTDVFTIAPDWACEILSAGTERVDRLRKSRVYAREGVGHFWLLHPTHRTLEVLRNVNGQWLQVAGFDLEEGDKLIRAEPFDAVELDFEALFRV